MSRPPARSDRNRSDRRSRPPRRDQNRPPAVVEATQPGLPTQPPGPLPEGALRVLTLGGIGEIGRNMTVFEYDGRLLVVDSGVLFPDADAPGVDLILPDFRPILDRLGDIDALVLTHGHEDHIGAVPFLLRQRPDLLIVGSPFTLALVAAKCKEHRLTPHMLVVNEGDRLRHGTFECEYFAVSHSIPQCLAVAIRTPAGVILHTGDIKLDQRPLDGRLTDLPGFSRLGDEGVDLFLCDSTNADTPGVSPSEASLGPNLAAAIGRAEGRAFVACFASNVYRVQQIVDGAVAHGRRICLLGRSMLRNMEIAGELGLLTVPEGTMVALDDVDDLPDEQVLVICTGSQGEPMAALSRIARGEHRTFQMRSSDTVILSSSLIPGNEHAVFGVVNRLRRAGIQVIDNRNANVHVSGHAYAGELLFLYNAVRPSNVMPVHGEWRHLRANAELAEQTGVSHDAIVVTENGITVDLVDGRAVISGRVEVGRAYVDGVATGDIEQPTLADRIVLGEGGFISITVAIDATTGRAVAPPTLSGRGFSEDPKALEAVLPIVEQELARTSSDGIVDTHRVAQQVRRVVGKWVGETYRRRPMIVPTVIAV
ncbi:ribonuclease J [Pseudonocardia sp. KRD-184]|uniref:Ribonuclease J n=1 Tax=Pseudonocardia oceani TaxID=2792013 RepID=A0ABS6U4N5_9PSEU|nr:ribonuclease J [Pseudonocardia oceani]MBW0096708.1 ribonuclease J [Pseudonocardia oceani]MBW0123983.1 ribonuclease J [Pseudonocardia oceani]MBW0127188.1 ribonuclease J [Pseudonocardia oceani]